MLAESVETWSKAWRQKIPANIACATKLKSLLSRELEPTLPEVDLNGKIRIHSKVLR